MNQLSNMSIAATLYYPFVHILCLLCWLQSVRKKGKWPIIAESVMPGMRVTVRRPVPDSRKIHQVLLSQHSWGHAFHSNYRMVHYIPRQPHR